MLCEPLCHCAFVALLPFKVFGVNFKIEVENSIFVIRCALNQCAATLGLNVIQPLGPSCCP